MKVWIVADDWEALERYHLELQRRLPHVQFEEFPFGATALEALLERTDWPAKLVLDLTLEDMTPAEFREDLKNLPPRHPLAVIEVGGPDLPRPFTYDELARRLSG